MYQLHSVHLKLHTSAMHKIFSNPSLYCTNLLIVTDIPLVVLTSHSLCLIEVKWFAGQVQTSYFLDVVLPIQQKFDDFLPKKTCSARNKYYIPWGRHIELFERRLGYQVFGNFLESGLHEVRTAIKMLGTKVIQNPLVLYRHLLRCIARLPTDAQGHYKHHVRQVIVIRKYLLEDFFFAARVLDE